MPIVPKYRLGDEGAARQFTDREELITVFTMAIPELPPDDYRLLIYYGVGGIGKSRLRKELCRLLKEQHRQVIFTALDFAEPTYRDVETALFWLRQNLSQEYKIQFPSFDLAYAQYWHKAHPQTSLRKDQPRLLEEGTLLADLISTVGDIPIVQWAPKISKLGIKFHSKFKEWWTKRGVPELYELQAMEPNDIVVRLPMFWAHDLKDFLQHHDRPIILFIDTYEALWEGQRTEGEFFSRDEWVRELVSHLKEVLWVITGRQKLRWQEENPDWGKHLEQHPVGGLADTDARSFLLSCGIKEEDIRQVIVRGSKGVPFYLDLAVDTYLQIKEGQERTPSPADFAGTPREVLKRFVRYLDRAETETLKVLSIPRFWDRKLFGLLVERFKTAYPVTALPELCRFSFVQEGETPATWTIHPLMREGLVEYQDAETRQQVRQFLFDYYCQPLHELDSQTITDVHKTCFTEAFHHAKDVLGIEEFFDWFSRMEQIFAKAALWKFLIPLVEEFAGLAEDRLGLQHPYTVWSLSSLASLYTTLGWYEQAEPLYKRAMEICEETGHEDFWLAHCLLGAGMYYTIQGQYAKAESCYERALAILEKVRGPEHPDVAQALNNLGELYRVSERCAKAASFHRRSLDIREQILEADDPSLAESLHNLALVQYTLGEYDQAETMFQRSRAILEKRFGSEHPNLAKTLDCLGALYFAQSRYDEAESMYKRALALQEKFLGPEHKNLAYPLNNLAALYNRLERYPEAEPLYQRALAIKEKALGPEHPDTIVSIKELAHFYQDQEQYAEAETLFQRVLRLQESTPEPDHAEIAESLKKLADLYNRWGKQDKAIPLYERAVENMEAAFGSDLPDIAVTLNSLAEIFKQEERYDDALLLYERIAGIWRRAFSDDQPQVASSLYNIGEIYCAQGKYEEAMLSYRSALYIRRRALFHGGPSPVCMYAGPGMGVYSGFYFEKLDYEEVLAVCERLLDIMKHIESPDYTSLSMIRGSLIDCYNNLGTETQIQIVISIITLYLRLFTVLASTLGRDHPELVPVLNDLGVMYCRGLKSYDDAERFFQRSLEITDKTSGPESADAAPTLRNLAVLYEDQGRYKEAEPLYKRALAINEEVLGPEHPDTTQMRKMLKALRRKKGSR